MVSKLLLIASALLPALSTAANEYKVISDPGTAGGPLELVHLYNDQWPTGTSRPNPYTLLTSK
jgi:hypothetical protein